MSITPKRWAEFQHYKDRSPPWIKLHRKLLDDYAFSRLPLASKALAPLLWLLAAEYEGGKITAGAEEIAFRLRVTDKELAAALKPLIESGFFLDDSEMLAPRKQSAMPETERETEKEVETETDIRAVASAPRPAIGQAFDEFWAAYPKREGANPKAPARKTFEVATKAGADPSVIIAGARNYAADPATKIGTSYVAQAVTWLRQQRWADYPESPTDPPKVVTGWRPGLPTAEELRAKYGNGAAKPNGLQSKVDGLHRKSDENPGQGMEGGVSSDN